VNKGLGQTFSCWAQFPVFGKDTFAGQKYCAAKTILGVVRAWKSAIYASLQLF